MVSISVAHATRRPAQALATREEWLKKAANSDRVQWVFGIDDDDEDAKRILSNEPHVIVPAGGGGVRAFNAAAKLCHGQIILAGSDDMFPPQNWDDILIERLPDPVNQSRVLLTHDGHRKDRLATMPIMTRGWYDRFGFIFPTEFSTVGPDVWLTERAHRDNCLIEALDLVFEHRHPYYGHGELDDVYKAQNAPEKYAECERILTKLLEPLPISLCMIVGNEETIIERCLDAAVGAFDELCLVQADGTSNIFSMTASLAEAWCKKNDKFFRYACYENKSDFPHVDDFSAARNLSFSLARQYWCLWLDADDLLDPINCARIRNCSQTSRIDAHAFRYLMPTGAEFCRERLIKNGKGIWRGAAHEMCHVSGTVAHVKQIEIRHAPPSKTHRVDSAARNLAILREEMNRLPNLVYYYALELLHLGKPEGLAAGTLALSIIPATMPIERYELLLEMIHADRVHAEKWGQMAIQISPGRREAFAEVSQSLLARGRVEDAAQYFVWMDAIPVPNPKPWTHRAVWHGWARDWLRVKLLRETNPEKAEETLRILMLNEEFSKNWKEVEG